jgi:hypothetical protein
LSIYYPEGDGITERGIRTVKSKNRLNTSNNKFSEKLEAAVMSINNLPNSGTQKVPEDVLQHHLKITGSAKDYAFETLKTKIH